MNYILLVKNYLKLIIKELRVADTFMQYLIKIQARIASRVVLEDRYSVEFVAGVDQAFKDELVISGAVVLDSSFKIKDLASCIRRTSFPYFPE